MEETIRILVVDDEPDIRRICRILLENSGYTVLEAATGLEAVETIRRCPEIDLILMDIMMPDLDGYDACSRLRACSTAGAVPHGQDAGERQAPRLRRRRRRLSGQTLFPRGAHDEGGVAAAALPGV